MDRCFACGKPLRGRRFLIDTRDSQTAIVGPDCFAHIRLAGDDGYQPPQGGPRLYEISQQLLESADD
jgi:hypothetical protein